jgi:hypothetical protein
LRLRTLARVVAGEGHSTMEAQREQEEELAVELIALSE